VPVIHRRGGSAPRVVVELPDHTVQSLPFAWTDRAVPCAHKLASSGKLRLSPLALLEVIEVLRRWEKRD